MTVTTELLPICYCLISLPIRNTPSVARLLHAEVQCIIYSFLPLPTTYLERTLSIRSVLSFLQILLNHREVGY